MEDSAGVADTDALARLAQSDDFRTMRFFRQTLFVRAGRQPDRRPSLTSLDACLVAGMFEPAGENGLRIGDTEFVLRDEGLTKRLADLGLHWPIHQPFGAIAKDDEQREALFQLFKMGLLHITTQPPPFAMAASNQPLASPLVRAQIRAGHPTVTSLHLETMKMKDPVARAFISLLDGGRSIEELSRQWDELTQRPDMDVHAALASIAAQRILLR